MASKPSVTRPIVKTSSSMVASFLSGTSRFEASTLADSRAHHMTCLTHFACEWNCANGERRLSRITYPMVAPTSAVAENRSARSVVKDHSLLDNVAGGS